MSIGRRILGLMKMQGISTDEMANYLCMHRTTFYRRVNDPDTFTLGELKRAAKLLKTTIEEIIGKGTA